MRSFTGKLAVVTGGGTGIGRELVAQLAADGCSVATCDVNETNLAATADYARKTASGDVRVTTHHCDVSNVAQVARFRDEVMEQHRSGHINLLFNNAGINGGSSFVTGSQDEWEHTFNVCWGGVYNCSRAFVPLLIASDEGCLVNTSSVNGFWAFVGPGIPHTAYSTAKFAIKGFSEAMLVDFRVNAPHVQVALVMPGHVGTDLVINSRRAHGQSDPENMTPEEIEEARALIVANAGIPAGQVSDDMVRSMIKGMGEGFRDNAPLSAADAATIILDGVRVGTWRILVGEDAHALDTAIRADPLALYEPGSPALASILGIPLDRDS
jgi:NAD(P)-dependent dehydrogenase (short-subunit alcohol dehydrogenase family)